MSNENGGKVKDIEQDRRLNMVEQHIATTNSEMGVIKEDVATIKNDIKWIKRLNFAILPILAGMVITLLYLIIGI